jgi:hypothetical protein
MTPKQQFIDGLNREHATTLKVLRAYPAGKSDLRPSPKSRTALELAWIFAVEQALAEISLTTGFNWAAPAPTPPPPATMAEVIAAFDKSHAKMVDLISKKDDNLTGTVKFPVAPKTLGDMPLGQFLWMLLCDQIHHRGQFSVYLRMAGGTLPSIYGPSADEPWG